MLGGGSRIRALMTAQVILGGKWRAESSRRYRDANAHTYTNTQMQRQNSCRTRADSRRRRRRERVSASGCATSLENPLCQRALFREIAHRPRSIIKPQHGTRRPSLKEQRGIGRIISEGCKKAKEYEMQSGVGGRRGLRRNRLKVRGSARPSRREKKRRFSGSIIAAAA